MKLSLREKLPIYIKVSDVRSQQHCFSIQKHHTHQRVVTYCFKLWLLNTVGDFFFFSQAGLSSGTEHICVSLCHTLSHTYIHGT